MSSSSSSSHTVLVIVHAPSVPIVSERRLPSDVPLRSILPRLELLTGIPSEAQRISLWSSRTDDADSKASLRRDCGDDAGAYARSLSELGVRDNMGIKIEDTRSGDIRDQFNADEEAKVDKYEMDDEAYARRTDSVLAYKQRNKMGRFGSPSDRSAEAKSTPSNIPPELQIGSRCEVEGGRRGVIRFTGETDFAKGSWIGVEYDEPVGKNDGSVAGRRYFDSKPNFGGFVRPEKVRAGAFPEKAIEEDEHIEEM